MHINCSLSVCQTIVVLTLLINYSCVICGWHSGRITIEAIWHASSCKYNRCSIYIATQ